MLRIFWVDIFSAVLYVLIAISALTLLVWCGRQGIWPVKKLSAGVLA